MSSTLQKRRRLLAGGVGVAVLSSLAGWVAASQVRSPAQVAADAAPPPPSVITAPVQERVLKSQIVTRGSVVATKTLQVGPPGPAGVLASIATAVPVRPGDQVEPGQSVLEVDGRPVILLTGILPAYRDLRSGMTGPDVAQLQQALAQLGRSVSPDVRGRFGAGTAAAVRGLYRHLGYTAGRGLPASEVVYAPAADVRVQAVTVSVGDVVTPDALTLSTGDLAVVSVLRPGEEGLVRPGMRVDLYSEILDRRLTGSVREVTANPPGALSQDNGPGTTYAVIASQGQMPREFVGQDIRVTLMSGESRGKVLVVPVSAVFSTADGHTSVRVTDNSDQAAAHERTVDVRVGITADGMAQVEPLSGGELSAGERVVVGSS